MIRSSGLLFLALAGLAACNPYDPDLGPQPFKCGSDDPRCPDGYECVSDVCVPPDTEEVDAADNTFTCSSDGLDSGTGNNDTTAQAFVTPISTVSSYSLGGLAICPGTDKDHFQIRIDQTGTNFSARVTSAAGRTPLSLTLLNSSGSLVASGAPLDDSPQVVALDLSNRLALGTYYVLVQSQDMTENNYGLSIEVCDEPLPCP